jgi:ABC-type Fe3+-hydroxamate transport system substrate-binding protein
MFNPQNEDDWKTIQGDPLWQGLNATKAGKVFTFNYAWWGAANYYGAYRMLDDVKAALA